MEVVNYDERCQTVGVNIDGNRYLVFVGSRENPEERVFRSQRKAATISEAYFCARTPDGEEEKVKYDPTDINDNKSGLAVRVKDIDGGEATLHIGGNGGLVAVSSFLNEANIAPKHIELLRGSSVVAYRDSIQLIGIQVLETEVVR